MRWRALSTDLERGLTAEEAPPVPIWRRILAQFRDPLIYLLLAAVVISLVKSAR
jgi:hypothetical protein